MKFDDRRHIIVNELTEELFAKVVAYWFSKQNMEDGGCVIMIT